MARLLSQIATQMRGSVGGITYTANQWYQIIARARTSPVNPGTSNQTIIRSVMAYLSAAWEGLSDAVKQQWQDYADTCIYQGPLGNYTLGGRQMFIACMSIPGYCNSRGLYAFGAVFTPPAIPGFYDIGPVQTTSYVGPGIGIALSITNETGEDGVAFVERSFAFPTSRNRFKGPFLSSSAQAVAVGTGAATKIEFDNLTPDLIYFTRVRCVTEDPPYRISAQHFLRHTAVEVTT